MIRRMIGARTVGSVFVVVMLLSIVQPSVAGSLVGPAIEIQATAPESQGPSIVFNPHHEEFLVVWWNQVDSFSSDIWARRIAIDGTPLSAFVIATAPGKKHFSPAVAYNNIRDEYFVVYAYEYTADDIDIRGRTVSWNGDAIGSELLVVTELDDQKQPAIAYNSLHDEYLVVYQNDWVAGVTDIAAQRVAGDLTLLSWANVATGPGTWRELPSVVFDEFNSQYLISYSYNPSLIVGPWTARAKVAAADLAGVSVAPEIQVCTVDPCGGTANASMGDGYLIVWYQGLAPRARRFAVNGTPVGAAGGFEIADGQCLTTTIPQHWTSVAYAPPVGYVTVWLEFDQSSLFQVRGRIVRPFTDGVTGQQLAVTQDATHQRHPWVACAPWGTCVVSYVENEGIYARMLYLHLFSSGFEGGDFGEWSSVKP